MLLEFVELRIPIVNVTTYNVSTTRFAVAKLVTVEAVFPRIARAGHSE